MFACSKYWLYLCFRDEGNTSHGQGRFLENKNNEVMKAIGIMMPRTHKHYIKKIRGWFYVFECDDLSGDAFFETKEEAEKYIAEIEEAWKKN